MDLPSISIMQPGFTLAPAYEDDTLLVHLSGNADMNAIRTLSSSLRRLHEEARRLAVREVVCDFSTLYFMNSSCFKAFVAWVTSVDALEPKFRYKIRLRTSHQLHWQKRSFEALRCLADKIVTVEQVEG